MSKLTHVIKDLAGSTAGNAEYLRYARRQWKQGFTLIESVAVVAIIGIISGIMLSTGTYAYRATRIQSTRAELAAIQSALEAYKSDYGLYPTTGVDRISIDGSAELSNTAVLYQALVAGPRRYLLLTSSCSVETIFERS